MMIKILKKSVLISLVLIALVGCQSLKEGFEGNRKSKNAEEFLINKKNPLILPPDFSKLPVPKNEKDKTDSLDDFDLEKILNKSSSDIKKTSKIDNSQKSIEKTIIEKINKN